MYELGRRRRQRRIRWLTASLTQWTWVWANSWRWWRTGKPGVLWSMGSQRVGHEWTTEQQQFSRSVMSNSAVPRIVARQASLSITNSWNLLKLMSITSVMPSNHLVLCPPPSPPAFDLSQHQGLFQWVSSLHQVAKVLELQLQHQSFQWIFMTYFL